MIAVFIISVSGLAISFARYLTTFAGISSLTVALLVFKFLRHCLTLDCDTCGISLSLNAGVCMSQDFNSSNKFPTFESLSRISSACTLLDKCLMLSTEGSSTFN